MPEIGSINAYDRLTRGGLLARNTVLNFLGHASPLIAAIFAIPLLVKGLGIDRFGALTIVWMVIGYFSLFDFGIARALTKFVAEKLGAGQEEEIPALVWTSLFLFLVLGIVGTVIVGLLSPWMVRQALNIPIELQTETLHSFYLLALSIPVVITTAGARGVLEAAQRFGFINAVRIGSGVFSYLAPLLVLLFSKSLLPTVAVLAAGRLVVLVLNLTFCLYVMPGLRHGVTFERAVVMPLLRFGGWITVSSIVSPIMVYLDRFLVAALVSIAAVAYYVTPYSVVMNLSMVPSALAGVLFPAFATSLVQDLSRTGRLFTRGVKYVFLALFPMALLIVAFARPGLDLWLGAEFAEHGTRVLQVLTAGVLINSLAFIPFSLVQSAGRPDLTAKLHLIELPCYLVAVWWMTRTFGIEGTAVVWSARVTVDAIVLFRMARGVLPRGSFGFRHAELPAGLALVVLAFGMIPKGSIIKGVFVALAMFLFSWAGWFVLLDSKERGWVRRLVRAGPSSETGHESPDE
jgi:O-antigen/teichoic acid export membrane protein